MVMITLFMKYRFKQNLEMLNEKKTKIVFCLNTLFYTIKDIAGFDINCRSRNILVPDIRCT